MSFIARAFRQTGYHLSDLFGLGSEFDGVLNFRRRAITIILTFFIVLIILTQVSLKFIEPEINIHDIKSAFVVAFLIGTIFLLQRLSGFFWVWLALTVAFFANIIFLGVSERTGIQTGAILLAVFMPIMGTYFIGRTGAIGGWLLGAVSFTVLYRYSLSHIPTNITTGELVQIGDLFLMSMGALTLSLLMALTLHQALVQALNEAQNNLERARLSEMERTRFFGTVSHEVRNSLNGIFGITTSLLRDEDLPDHTRRQIELVQSSGDSLVRVLNDMLELTRLESNGIEIIRKPTELRAVTLRTASRWQLSATDKHLDILIENDPQVPEWGLIDYARLTQVMDNLLSNAIRFTNHGHIKLSMSASSIGNDQIMLNIRVSDTGVGIQSEQIEKIFEPYRQESSSTFAKHGGTGLGLYICRLLLSQMNGTINVEHTGQNGTVFRISLPVDLTEAPAEDQLLQKGAASVSTLTRILAVDDRLPNRVYLQTLFKSWGINVITAESGADCLRKAKSEPFDLLLLDLNMPEMNGLELLTRLRNSNSVNRDIQAVVVSAEIPEDTELKLRDLDVQHYLKKPITPKMLWETVNHACADIDVTSRPEPQPEPYGDGI